MNKKVGTYLYEANRDLVRQLQLLKALEQELEQLAKLESSARKLPSPSAGVFDVIRSQHVCTRSQRFSKHIASYTSMCVHCVERFCHVDMDAWQDRSLTTWIPNPWNTWCLLRTAFFEELCCSMFDHVGPFLPGGCPKNFHCTSNDLQGLVVFPLNYAYKQLELAGRFPV